MEWLLYEFEYTYKLKRDSEEYKRLQEKLDNLSIQIICSEIMNSRRELRSYGFINHYIKKYILGDITDIAHIICVGQILISDSFVSYMNDTSKSEKLFLIGKSMNEIDLFFKETGLCLRDNIDLFCTMLGSSNDKIRIAKEIYISKKDEYKSDFMNFVLNLVVGANGDNHALEIKKLLLGTGDREDLVRFSSFDLGVSGFFAHAYRDELPYMKYLRSIAKASGEKQLEYVLKLYKSEGVSLRNINDRLTVIEYAMVISQTKDRNISKYIYELYFKYPFIIGVNPDKYYHGFHNGRKEKYYLKCLKLISSGNCIEKVKLACSYFEEELEKTVQDERDEYWIIGLSHDVEIILDSVGIPQAKMAYRVLSSNKKPLNNIIARYVSEAVGYDQAHAACLFYFNPSFYDLSNNMFIVEKITKMDSFIEVSKLINSYGVFPLKDDMDEKLDNKDYELMFRVCGVVEINYDKKIETVVDNTEIKDNVDSKRKVRKLSDRIKKFFSR